MIKYTEERKSVDNFQTGYYSYGIESNERKITENKESLEDSDCSKEKSSDTLKNCISEKVIQKICEEETIENDNQEYLLYFFLFNYYVA